jgi:hypothetical protein
MEPKFVKSISEYVYRKFPEMAGKKPRIRKQPNGQAKTGERAAVSTYLLTFRGKGEGPGGVVIPRWVRVVANNRGKILKVSTSRG